MMPCHNTIDRSCSPPPENQPWQVSCQVKAHYNNNNNNGYF